MILGIILGSIVSIGLSIGIELKNLCGVFKKIADNGYVLDIEKFDEFMKNNNTKLMDKFFWNYVPGINILNVIRRDYKYKSITDENISELCNHVCFRKMSLKELEMYLENPYGIIGLCIPFITDKIESTFNGRYTELNENNDYFVDFDLDSKTGKVTIKNMNIKKCSLSVNEIEENIRKTFLLQEKNQPDKHNMDLRNVTIVSEKKEEVKKETKPYYVASYDIKKGDMKIHRDLTPRGFDEVSNLMHQDLEILEENDGPKLILK